MDVSSPRGNVFLSESKVDQEYLVLVFADADSHVAGLYVSMEQPHVVNELKALHALVSDHEDSLE